MSAPRARRSLTHVGGAVDRWGDANASELLAGALAVEASRDAGDGEDRSHVHGFHAYPARMHPTTARRLVDAFAPASGVVLDPFCGSGTVLVEAILAGRRAVGTDLNPLAVRLARLKTERRSAGDLAMLVEAAKEAAAHATERRKARAGATRRYPPADVALFDAHVLLELDGVRAGIERLAPRERNTLALVLSAMVTKVSKKESETSQHATPRRLAAGYPTKLFVRKAEELAQRMTEFAKLLPRGAEPAKVAIDDARELETVDPASVDLVVTSPPYVATYDYVAHHALRLRWLGIDPGPFAEGEIGARRRYNGLALGAARAQWTNELVLSLRAIARTLRHDGVVVMLMADSALRSGALRADEILRDAALASGFELVARASQARPHFHAPTARAFEGAPRAEHAVLLERRGAAT